MAVNRAIQFLLAAWLIVGQTSAPPLARADEAPLPKGAKAVWDLNKAYRDKTATRQRICLNGLWRWQPAKDAADAVPTDRWGYFKVPGSWPGITDYMQKDCQTLWAHPDWKDLSARGLGSLTSAWYQREITVPEQWAQQRVALSLEYLNSYATLFVDGKKVGEVRFPTGEADLTSVCRPGGKYMLSLLVVAMPLKGVMLSYGDTASAKEVKGSVARRGLCGDAYLVAEPPGPRLADVKADTFVRKWEITFDAALLGLAPDGQYVLRAQVSDNGRSAGQFTSQAFKAGDLKDGRIAFTAKWKPGKLWDLHTPGNTYDLSLTLLEAGGKVLDVALPVRLGFREFWIAGRDFYLNGSRIFLSAVPLDNAQVGAAWASYAGARESLERLKGAGINFVYTHNYDCQPGSHLSFAEVLRAADDVGMLVSLSQPHFGNYDWKAPDADLSNGYGRHAEFYTRVAGSHPSVVFYSMSHNATGYAEDMNPDLIDGVHDPRDNWSANNAKLALRAEAIVKRLDPGRIVYHHSSGNLGSMHTVNFYPNFTPIQELCDWFEHWATQGVKPVFLCEYGAPFTWDWSMYRGWYKGQRSFGSAAVPWEFCFAEWNAQFLGDRAFRLGEPEKANLRWEARQFRAGNLWHRWDYPYEIGSTAFDDRYQVFAAYLTDNWRAYRTWGLSANSPWEHGHFWKLRDGLDRKGRQDLKVDWENLQRPGFSPDYLQERYERMDLAYEPSDWAATPAAEALVRNNAPLLAYIAGGPQHFTEKGHNYLPGQSVAKQIIVINNSRQPVSCECQWSLGWTWEAAARTKTPLSGSSRFSVETGQQARIPVRFELPGVVSPGAYEISLTAKFSTGESQKDSFTFHVLPQSVALKSSAKIALLDPKGQTAVLLKDMGVNFQRVDTAADLSGCDMLIVGKEALTADGPAPNIGSVRDGLRVVMFEQTSEVLEERFGFRVAEYGLRNIFSRVPDHPLLAGVAVEHLRDWRGEATILPSRLKYTMRSMYGPTVKWCDIDVTRPWRCGNYGNVASVLIEKPARGDFLPIVDGGFSLQYSPLMEYHEGKGMVLFCQLDVTGRTENDPAAQRLARNIIEYVSAWKPKPDSSRKALYVGDPAGKAHLEKAGVSLAPYEGGKLSAEHVLIVGPGGGRQLSADAAAISDWLRAGGHLLAIGLDEAEAREMLPFKVAMKKAEHISCWFEPPGVGSPLAGIGPADVHNRDPRVFPLVSGGALAIGDGVLAKAQNADVIFCQLAAWQFDYSKQYNVKRTYRRASFVLARLLAGMGIAGSTPILERFETPVASTKPEKRWLDGLYLDQPEELDDPYRFFRW
jgi:hypothetical protein